MVEDGESRNVRRQGVVMGVRGERVSLCETRERDLPRLLRLWNDGRVMRWVGFSEGLGFDEKRITEWFRAVNDDPDRHHFVIYVEEIGFCGEAYYAVDRRCRRASLDIKLTPEAQGRGLATDALRTLIRLVFASEFDVDAVWTEPSPVNRAAQRLYQRCGLRPTARPRDLPPGETYWERRRGGPDSS